MTTHHEKMNDDEIWNPTRRLYEILAKAKQHGQTMEPSGHYPPVRKVIAHVFEINPEDTISVYRCLGLLSDALIWTSNQIENSDIKQKSNYTRNLPTFRRAIENGNINNSWEVFRNDLSDEAMADLLHTASRLGEIHAEISLSKEELKELSDELAELIELFHNSEIDHELRIAILDLLVTAQGIIGEYRIRGGEALKKIIELALGKIMTKGVDLSKEQDPTVLQKLGAFLAKLDALYSRLGKYEPLLRLVAKFLPIPMIAALGMSDPKQDTKAGLPPSNSETGNATTGPSH